ncbi:MAG: ferredoxin [Bacillota bacterium]|nr:ferredoxin [Bacillota bacterium]HOB91113.1 ferredoxin [Bacillota bacterium]HPZ54239.1 ferredoxin [Bacillota bacterium]HQD18717.1 ferredoxin [Bacillota bacterium]
MKATVDKDLCISCGLCIQTCPDVFDWDDDDKAVAIDEEVPEEFEDEVYEAADGCPTDAISVEK